MSRAFISSFVILFSGFISICLLCRMPVLAWLAQWFQLRRVGLCFLLVGSLGVLDLRKR
jgi:hypothetical protein